jgi:hypothetical protein
MFRPNLADRVPPAPPDRTFWLVRWGRALARLLLRLLKLPEPAVKVP